MKNIYIIGGTMGVGKTTVSQILKKKLDSCVFLDGDWCWDADPFTVTEETKLMVMQNITFLLNQFIHCSAYRNIVFCWVLHDQAIIDDILSGMDLVNCNVKVISLICSEEQLRKRLYFDVTAGKRKEDVIERSVLRLPLYRCLNTIKIVTDYKLPEEIATEISQL